MLEKTRSGCSVRLYTARAVPSGSNMAGIPTLLGWPSNRRVTSACATGEEERIRPWKVISPPKVYSAWRSITWPGGLDCAHSPAGTFEIIQNRQKINPVGFQERIRPPGRQAAV